MLQRRQWLASEGIAPHFARRWLALPQNKGQQQVRSTLSGPLQRFAVSSLQQHLRELQGRNVEDGAAVVLDNASGEILAWVGSSGTLSQASEVDGVTALRQPGSTLKPFLYAQALAEKRITAASLIEDSSAHIPTQSGLYIPQNYDRRFKGWVSARTALASSLNVPAVRTLVMVTPDAFFEQLTRLGLALRESGGYYGFSLTLGSSEVALLNLTNAYRALGNGGLYRPVSWALAPSGSRMTGGKPSEGASTADVPVQALDPRAAFIVGDILSDNMARAPTFGTDSVLATRFWTAVKTGTSKDMRDNWAVGWSQRYTVGVWVGNASGAAMHDVSGSSGAAPIWASVMAYLHARQPSRAPQPPPALVRTAVRFGTAPSGALLEAPRPEWFLPGTSQALFAMDFGAVSAYPAGATGQKSFQSSARTPDLSAVRISAPASGTIVALDPDIPPLRQRLQLAASANAAGAGDALRWRLNGKALGRGEQLAWPPWPGRHVLQLTDAQGTVLDEVRIEVRGAGVRAAP